MKKILLALTLFLGITTSVSAITFDLFYSPSCPHCHHAMKFIDEKLKKEFPTVKFKKHNVFISSESKIMKSKATKLGISRLGVPLVIVEENYVSGFGSPETTGQEYKDLINSAFGVKKKIINNKEVKTIDAGWFGEIDLVETSIPVLAIVLGLVDGFNPCAMWVLVFMIGIILEIKDRKKVWTIVGTFVLASGILYFLFMTIWFNAFQLMGQITWIQRLLGAGALYMAYRSLKDFYIGHVECEVGDLKSKKKTRDKITKIIQAPMNIALFFSIVGLAFTVNAIEFACSLGLPAIFTGVLAQADLSSWAYYGYIGLYDLFFMLDDLVIFGLAAFAVDKFVGDKYVKYCKLLGGVVLLILAVVLLIAPGILR